MNIRIENDQLFCDQNNCYYNKNNICKFKSMNLFELPPKIIFPKESVFKKDFRLIEYDTKYCRDYFLSFKKM